MGRAGCSRTDRISLANDRVVDGPLLLVELCLTTMTKADQNKVARSTAIPTYKGRLRMRVGTQTDGESGEGDASASIAPSRPNPETRPPSLRIDTYIEVGPYVCMYTDS